MPTTTVTVPSTQPAPGVEKLSFKPNNRSAYVTQSHYSLTSQHCTREISFNPHPQPSSCHSVPEWVLRVVRAAAAGEVEFRCEAARLIREGKGQQLLKFMKDLEAEAPLEAARGMQKLVARVERWIRDPQQAMYGDVGDGETLVFSITSPPREVAETSNRHASATFAPISLPLNVSNSSTPTFSTPSPRLTPTPMHTPSPIQGSTSFEYENENDLHTISSPGPSSMRGQWVEVDEVRTHSPVVQRGRAFSYGVESEGRRAHSCHPPRSPSPSATLYVGVW